VLREGGGGAMSGRRREEALHKFQQGSGVATSRGDRRSMYVALVGVNMSWVWCKRSAGLKGLIKPPLCSRLLQHGKTTPDANDERQQRACAEGDGGTWLPNER
jgi:hypothetical protein